MQQYNLEIGKIFLTCFCMLRSLQPCLIDIEEASAFLEHSDIISSTFTPMVGLLIQGGPIDIEHVVDLLRKRVPVLVVKGTGLAADLVSFAFNEKIIQ